MSGTMGLSKGPEMTAPGVAVMEIAHCSIWAHCSCVHCDTHGDQYAGVVLVLAMLLPMP